MPASITDPDFPSDRYALYARLHAETPVFWDERARAFLIAGFDDVSLGYRSPKLSARRVEAFARAWSEEARREVRPLVDSLSLWILFQDPPDHTRLRTIMMKAFTPKVVESMRPRIQALVDRMLDEAGARAARAGGFDVVRDLAFPLPATVILELLGIPLPDRDRFKAWSSDIARLVTNLTAQEDALVAKRAVVEMGEYFAPLFAARRASPQDDLVSALIAATDRGDVLSDAELLANCVLLMFAGHETTTNLIGNGVLALLQHPEQRARLVGEPSLIGSAVEELLRYEAPVQLMRRTTLEPLEMSGVTIPAGSLVGLLIGAANRDPKAFPEPERLDLARKPRHAAFGFGPHFCIGAALARAEGEIAIETLFRRFPDLRLADAQPRWKPNAA